MEYTQQVEELHIMEDYVEDAISNAIGTERFQDVLSKVNEYQKNLEYINNNPTKFNWR